MPLYTIDIGAAANDGTGDPLRTAFNEVNLNFEQVFTAGPVLSNVQIANNTILTTNTNGNLVLAPNGVGVVQANVNIVPNTSNTRNLGAADRRWSTLYIQYANISGAITVADLTATGNVTVGGNLSVTGNIINVANIITDAKTIQLANTASTANAANGSGITVGANDAIATFLFSSSANAWTTNLGLNVTGNIVPAANTTYSLGNSTLWWSNVWVAGNTMYIGGVPIGMSAGNVLTVGGNAVLQNNSNTSISTTGNVTADYFFGNGSQLTGLSANSIFNGNSNVAIATADGNVTVTTAGTNTWTFATAGQTIPPTLNVARGDNPSGNISGFTLNLGDGSQEAIITTPDGDADGDPNSQRIVINPGKGADTTSGEGGDIYLWAGRGGDQGGTGGDVKIRGGQGMVDGSGGYIRIEGGDSQGAGAGGYIDLIGGTSTTSTGGPIQIQSGQGVAGANIDLTGGTGTAGPGGSININGGVSANGLAEYGNVAVTAGASTWTFDNGGNLTLPDSTSFQNFGPGSAEWHAGANGYVSLASNNGNTYMWVDNNGAYIGTNWIPGSYVWTFANTGSMTAPGAINVGDMSIGTVPGDITANANTGITVNVSGPDGGFAVNYLDEVGNANTSGGELAFSSETGNATYRISLSDDLGDGFATKIWRFDGTGNFNLPSGGNIVGVTAYNSGRIQWVGNSSGDGAGYTTLGLIPDDTLVGNDQYLIIDPTAPGHIHIRAGGQQDNSNADLFLGGEYTHFKVTAGANNQARIMANSWPWTFGADGTFTLPANADLNGSQINSVANSSGDGAGYTTLQLVPDVTIGTGTDQYVILDPTAPGHIHIRAGGTQDNSSADLFLGGENSHVKIAAGANSDVVVRSNSNNWTFDTLGTLTLPGEGVLRSIGDVVTLQSINVGSGNANSVYLGSSGGLGFFDQEIGGNWLEIFRSGAEPEIRVPVGRGNLNIQTAQGNTVYNWTFDNTGNFTASGAISTTGNITAGNFIGSGSNVDLVAGAYDWTFDSTGNLTTPQGMVISGNVNFLGTDTALIRPADGTPLSLFSSGANGTITSFWTDDVGNLMTSNIAAIYTPLQGTQTVRIVNGNNGGNVAIYDFDNTGMFTTAAVCATGNVYAGNVSASGNVTGGNILTGGLVSVTGNVTGNYFIGNGSQLTGLPAGYANSDVASFLAAFGSNTISTTGNITAGNFIGNISLTGNIQGTSANVELVAGSYTFTFDNTGVATFPTIGGDEGGEIHLGIPAANTTLQNSVKIDVYQDRLRFFEGSANTKGAYVDLANCPNGVATAIGYREIPQIAFSANATAAANAAGCHYYSTTAGNLALTLPDNSSVAFPTGATLTVVVNAAGNVLVNQGTGVTLYQAGASATGNRVVGAYGLATVMKVAANTWVISGTGVY